jgi:hypothetical protein
MFSKRMRCYLFYWLLFFGLVSYALGKTSLYPPRSGVLTNFFFLFFFFFFFIVCKQDAVREDEIEVTDYLEIFEKRSLITILDGNIPWMGDIRRITGWGKGMEFIRSRLFITSLGG